MPDLPIRLFTDEDIDPKLAFGLRRRGHDAVSCHEVGRANRRIPDDEQLRFAAAASRAIVTFNARDYLLLDRRWKERGLHHAVIIDSPRVNDLGELPRRVERHLQTHSAESQQNQVRWLR